MPGDRKAAVAGLQPAGPSDFAKPRERPHAQAKHSVTLAMAIHLQSLNLLVPMRLISARYPGGIEACIDDHESLIGTRIWFDASIWRHGADTPDTLAHLVEGWRSVGLSPLSRETGVDRWRDLCVVDSTRAGRALPCCSPWLELSDDGEHAWLSGTAPGHVFGPGDFPLPRPGPRPTDRPSLAALLQRMPRQPLPRWLRLAMMRG
jgi:hypothetical protein